MSFQNKKRHDYDCILSGIQEPIEVEEGEIATTVESGIKSMTVIDEDLCYGN